MKNIIFISVFISIFAIPVFASCPIDGGVCTASGSSALTLPTMQDKFLPNNLENIQKPDAFTPNIIEPYNKSMINFEENVSQEQPTMNNSNEMSPQVQYNASCQFGVCIP